MCNFIRPNQCPNIKRFSIPETGDGYKITEIRYYNTNRNHDNFSSINIHDRNLFGSTHKEFTPFRNTPIYTGKVFNWDVYFNDSGDGFTFFRSFDDALLQLKHMIPAYIYSDINLAIRKISYFGGLCEREEPDRVIIDDAKIALATGYEVLDKIIQFGVYNSIGNYCFSYNMMIDNQFIRYKDWKRFFNVDRLRMQIY